MLLWSHFGDACIVVDDVVVGNVVWNVERWKRKKASLLAAANW